MKRLIGYILAVMLCAIVAALILNAVLVAMPGLWPILAFGICWYAQELPTLDLDAELIALLKEA